MTPDIAITRTCRVVSGLVVIAGCLLHLFSCSGEGRPALPKTAAASNADSNAGLQGNRDTVEYQHDFGLVLAGEVVRHTFRVRNSTNIDWHLVEIANSCSCAVVEDAHTVVRAGDFSEFDFVLRPPGNFADVSKTSRLTFQENEAPTIVLCGSARLRPHVGAFPERLDLGPIYGSDARAATVNVMSFAESVVGPPSVMATSRFVDCSIEPMAAPPAFPESRQAWRLVVTVRNPEDEPLHRSGNLVHTEDVKVVFRQPITPLVIPVAFRAATAFQAFPSSLHFGGVRPGSTVSRTFYLRKADSALAVAPESLSIDMVAFPDAVVSHKQVSASMWRLDVQVTFPQTVGSLRDDTFLAGTMAVSIPVLASSRHLTVGVPLHARMVHADIASD